MRKVLALLFALASIGPAVAQNYTATQGAGTTFGSKLVGGVNYPQQTMCDPSTPSQCLAVDASGRVTVLQGTSPWVVSNGGTFAVQAAQSGTWTVQPGNTPNTTAWLVTGTGGVFPASQSGTWNITNISGTVSLPTGASTSALQTTGNTSLSSIDTKTPSLVSNASSAVATGSSNVPGIAYLYGFNGTTYDQLQVDASKFLKVNCSAGCSSSTSITNWGGGVLGAMANYGTSPGAVLVPGVNAFVTNSNANGRAVVANSSPVVPVAAASTAGAIVPNNTTAVVVKGSAGTLFGVQIYGIGSAPAYLKIYNATSATCGSGTPVKRLMIPAASTAANGAGSNVSFGQGLAFATGITYCVTTGIGDADTTAPAASTFLVNVDYE